MCRKDADAARRARTRDCVYWRTNAAWCPSLTIFSTILVFFLTSSSLSVLMSIVFSPDCKWNGRKRSRRLRHQRDVASDADAGVHAHAHPGANEADDDDDDDDAD